MKSFIFRFLTNPLIAPVLMRLAMRLHTSLYDLCGILAVAVNKGMHPKHRILRYKEWFLEHIETSDVVLDIGSNTGALAILMAEKCRQVYGIEIDPLLARRARKLCREANVEILVGDATTYNYDFAQPISCITLSNVLEHIEDRVDFLRRTISAVAWSELTERKILIRVPTIERDWLSVYKKEVGVEYRLDRTHAVEHTRHQLFEELGHAGLRLISFEVRFGEYFLICEV